METMVIGNNYYLIDLKKKLCWKCKIGAKQIQRLCKTKFNYKNHFRANN